MGTTVSAILRVGDQVAIAHIGDSRIYLLRDGELTQISADHTFVQRLVDTGRITPEEAAVHPRRSVLMRVLGDVDCHPGDRHHRAGHPAGRPLAALLRRAQQLRLRRQDPAPCCSRHRARRMRPSGSSRRASSVGAPDNVTVVVRRHRRDRRLRRTAPPAIVGSAALPLSFESDASTALPATAHPAAASAQGHPAGGQPLRAGVGRVPRRAHRGRPAACDAPAHRLADRHRPGHRRDRRRRWCSATAGRRPTTTSAPTARPSRSSRACNRTSGRSRSTASTRRPASGSTTCPAYWRETVVQHDQRRQP